MKIKQLHFFRYGMFTDTVFHFASDGLQVVYGVNEAGKSTMMRFIREVLFGFSAQSPGMSSVGGGTFGGRLKLELPKYGVVTVERTGLRGRGSAKVYFDDGRVSGEEALAELLPGLDAAMFAAIFSFGLDGLQDLERVKADQLNDYLFHAGMTGDFSIRKLEKELVKKQDELFKPQGRKPLLNRQLAELELLEKDVAAWQRKNESYRELDRESDDVERRIAEAMEAKETLRKEIRTLEKQKALAPYVKDKRELELRLERLPESEPFPEDGLARFEEWRRQAVALEAELVELETEKEAIEKKLAGIEVREDWLELKQAVCDEREQERFMQNKESERAAREQTARTEKEELAVLMERLGSLWTEERIEAADTGFGARDEMKKLVQGRESLQQRRNVMDDERERLGQLLEESRAEREAISAKRLADDERLRLEKTLHKKDELERKRKEKKELEGRLAHASSLPSHLPFYGGTALGTGGVVWMISNEQWIAGAVLAILTAGFAFSILRSGRGTQLDQLKKELASLTEELRQVNGAGIEGAEKAKLILQEDDRTRESEVIVKDRLAQSERAFDEAVEQTEAVRQQLKSIDRKIGEWCAAYHFPGKLGPEQLSETFERVEEAKTRIRRRRRADEIGQSIEIELEKRENKIRNMCRVFGIDYENSASAVSRMAERIEEQEDLQYKKEHLHENSHEYKRRIGSLKEKIQRYQRECNDLMRQAETESEEAYRRKGKAWQESRSLLKEITALQAKIETLIPEEAERKQTIEAVFQSEGREEDEISRCEKEVKELESQEQSLFERRAALNEQKKQLEEGGTYSELLHELERKKDHFRNETRKWAVYRTAEHLLQMAKERYRDKRLPKVVETASKFFVLMTDGRYSAVFAPKDEGFVVERMDGVRFLPSQLSRGTAEQLYLALRLALARIYQSPSPYPLIMDDILVNFDSFRTKKAVEAVREAAHHHQILLFTCHAHLLEHFPDNMIVPIEQTTLSAQ